MQYRRLKKGEIIQKGDQCDVCVDPWNDRPIWEDVVGNIGEPAPDPSFPSHRQYRRPVYPNGYETMIEAMRRSNMDVPHVIIDIRNCLVSGDNVPAGQAAAAIDYLIEVIERLRDCNYGLKSAREKQ